MSSVADVRARLSMVRANARFADRSKANLVATRLAPAIRRGGVDLRTELRKSTLVPLEQVSADLVTRPLAEPVIRRRKLPADESRPGTRYEADGLLEAPPPVAPIDEVSPSLPSLDAGVSEEVYAPSLEAGEAAFNTATGLDGAEDGTDVSGPQVGPGWEGPEGDVDARQALSAAKNGYQMVRSAKATYEALSGSDEGGRIQGGVDDVKKEPAPEPGFFRRHRGHLALGAVALGLGTAWWYGYLDGLFGGKAEA